MRRLLCALAFGLVAAPAAADPYDGVYRPDQTWAEGWNCSDVGSDGGAMAVQDGWFYGVESACQLTNPVSVRDLPATLYDAECSSEGETYTQRVMLMSTARGVVLVNAFGASPLVRCE